MKRCQKAPIPITIMQFAGSRCTVVQHCRENTKAFTWNSTVIVEIEC